MIYRVIIQPNAEAELEAAYLYRYERAPQEAARWFAGFVEAINSLAQFPTRCPLAPENGHFAEEIRQLLYGTRRNVGLFQTPVDSFNTTSGGGRMI